MTVFDSDVLAVEANVKTGVNEYKDGLNNIDFQTMVSIGVKVNSQYVYGMASREGPVRLESTALKDPYHFFAGDWYNYHGTNLRVSLYGQ